MSWTNRMGEQVARPEPHRLKVDPDKMIDLMIVKGRALGLGWRVVGASVRMTHEGARKRYLSLPEPVREHYRRAALG